MVRSSALPFSLFAHSRVGNIKPTKLIQKTVSFQDVLCKLSDVWHISDDMEINLEEFTCAIYGKSRHKRVNDLRYSILKLKCINLESNIDLSQFPPCRKILSQHIRRVNQTGIWKLAHIPQPYIPPAIKGHYGSANTFHILVEQGFYHRFTTISAVTTIRI